jgi:predicted transcriptional regulator
VSTLRTSKVLTVSLPPELLDLATRLAEQEGRTKSELFREALRQYAASRTRWQQIRSYGRQKAKQLRITEEDVERIVQEYRREATR